jgi:hypothetical protein
MRAAYEAMRHKVRLAGFLALLLTGCLGRSSEYEHYVHEACADLQRRQDKLIEEYQISTWERYDWNQDKQELVFSQQGQPKVIAKIQFVGSFSNRSNTWRWAWANDTVVPGMKQDVILVKAFGEQRGWKRLVTPQWNADEQDGWDMTAVAVRLLNAKGAYRTPDEDGLTFMIIKDIRWSDDRAGGT